MRVVVCGGGVIGACTAYFLSQRGADVVVVERAGVANGASGKSGGFLALDWCDGTPLAALARRSFALHETLAADLDGDWGYRRLDTLSVTSQPGVGGGGELSWLDGAAAVRGQIGTTATTAQIDPQAFTQGMMAAAQDKGATLREGVVTGVGLTENGDRVTGAEVDGALIEGDALVITMGPWSVLACQWLPLPAVYGLKGHSLVFRPREAVTPHALFVDMATPDGEQHTPEVFPRPDGTTYVCGLRGHDPLPVDPAEVAPEDGALEQLRDMTAQFSPTLGEAEVISTQACYRPITADGLPLMGQVDGITGAYVATGHGVWGMLNGPASGEAMAELIVDGRSNIDLSAFAPGRMAAAQLP